MNARTSGHFFFGLVGLLLMVVSAHVGHSNGHQQLDKTSSSRPVSERGAISEPEVDMDDYCSLTNVFRCGDGQCIPADRKCNGVAECENGEDESVRECGCLDNEFYCNGTCIDLIARCDKKVDCDDHTDEQDCETFSCLFPYFKCKNHYCIPDNLMCNFNDDCGDDSDEMNCAPRSCYFGEFQCDSMECIRAGFVCDGIYDCKDQSDEIYCDIKKNFVECGDGSRVHQMVKCDGWPDCKDNHADELNCRTCTEQEFQCGNTRCIPKGNICDGVCDCVDNCEDERNCGRQYHLVEGVVICEAETTITCKGIYHNRCISAQYLCDGSRDCRQGYLSADETGCTDVQPQTRFSKRMSKCELLIGFQLMSGWLDEPSSLTHPKHP